MSAEKVVAKCCAAFPHNEEPGRVWRGSSKDDSRDDVHKVLDVASASSGTRLDAPGSPSILQQQESTARQKDGKNPTSVMRDMYACSFKNGSVLGRVKGATPGGNVAPELHDCGLGLGGGSRTAGKGESGVTGPQGEKGQSGAIGKPGHKGEKGFRGWRGLEGAPGSACVLKGNKGPAGLRGGQGLKGDPGPSGDPAHPGVPGKPGHKGDPGLRGGPGVEGVQGPRGEPGLRGTKGLKGLGGPSGPLGHLGPVGAPGLTGQPGLPGQVFLLEGLQGEAGSPGPLSSSCDCSPHPRQQPRPHRVQKIFIADGEEALRKLQKENTMVLRTDKKALYIFTEQQWVNVLNPNSDSTFH
ncbi:uncharacterized protein [Nerophis lumbriciformis]|uniref:uncharacterized protein n=1 Tax=Nerophis lumbriciformis TaxID=546530 RepID=UPI003BAC5AE7